jgi:hypothetical protein
MSQAPPPTATATGDRVYDGIPDDLIVFWEHVQIEAGMRNRLPEALAEAARLKGAPKTREEIRNWLRDLEGRLMMADVFSMILAAQSQAGRR